MLLEVLQNPAVNGSLLESGLFSPAARRIGCESQCPGCGHRDWSALKSETQKRDWIQRSLGCEKERISPVQGMNWIGAEGRFNYRRKTCLHSKWNENRWIFGLKKRDDVIEIPDCPVHSALVRSVVKTLSQLLPSDEQFPLVFLTIAGTLVTLVIKSKKLPQLPFVDWASLGVTGVYFNLNPCAGNRVYFNRGWQLVWGQAYGKDQDFHYGPDSFQQLIPELHQRALEQVLDFLNPAPQDGVIDLYSGIGRSLALWKARRCSFMGVELSGEAFSCAQKNLGGDFCLRGRVSDRIPQLQKWIDQVGPRELLAYVNPPRLGIEAPTLQWLGHQAKPKRLAYLSCSPGTMARDLSILGQAGYALQRIIPYDFFPQTRHIETLALMDKK